MAMQDIRRNALWSGLMDLGASLMANSGPSMTPVSPWQSVGQGLAGFNRGYQGGVNQGMQSLMAESQMSQLEQEQKAREALGNLLTPNPQTADAQGQQGGLMGMPQPTPDAIARARGLFSMGDADGARKALFAPPEKPLVREFNVGDRVVYKQSADGGRTWQDMEGVGGPRYRPTTTVTVDAGTKSDIGKLVSDRRALVGLYGENSSAVKAIDRKIEIAGQNAGLMGDLNKRTVNASEALSRLTEIESSFRPEFQQIGTRAGMAVKSLKEMAGLSLDEGERKSLEEFSIYRRDAFAHLNRTLNELSGAAVNEHEAKRLKQEIPDAGSGLFDGDSPTQFKAKLEGSIKAQRHAIMRYNYAIKNGMNPLETGVELQDVPKLVEKRGTEIEQQVRQANPGMPDANVRAQVRAMLANEFGLQ